MMEHSDQPDRGSPNGLMRPAHSDSDLISRLRNFNLNPPHYLHRHQQQQQQQPQQHEELQQTPPTRSSDSFVTPKKKKRSSRKAWLAQLNCCLTRTDSIPDLSDQQQQHGERFEMGEIPAGADGIVLEPDAFQVAEDEAPPPTGHLARGAFNQFYSPPPLPVNPYNSPIQLPLPPPPMPGPEPIYRPIAARVDGDDSPPMVNMPPFPFAMPHDLLAAIPISFARQRLQMHHLDPVPPVSMYPPGGNFRWVRADPIHTQIDYINTLVPDLKKITNCSFYWGKMDRYEAEKLLEGKPEGTFLLRDSAQDDHLFSVSFRRFDRSLHARIEHWQHKFSFDSHDPGVFSSPTVTGLIERYKDPSHCMFFEPMLTRPLNRSHPFSLQHLARVTICDLVTYEMVQKLPLPSLLKCYLREYHYRTKVRTKHFDEHQTYLYYQPPAPPGGPPPPDHNQETNHYLELM